MGSAADWHAFLDEFRSFGGRAENVMQRKGSLGVGLFPIDASKPIDLHVPDELLIPTDNIELKNGEINIINDENIPKNYADWFHRYQQLYSWGAEGKENILKFETGLKSLPEKIQNILKRIRLYNSQIRFPEEDQDNEILTRFIETRCINRKNKRVIMPIIDLVNHDPTVKPYEVTNDGINIRGMYDGEVLVRYNISDPIRRLIGYGFNSPEPLGHSVFCRIQHQNKTVIVQGGLSDRPMQPCNASFIDDRLLIEKPLLGSLHSPKLPRTIFLNSCQNLEGIDGLELFDQIQQSNTIIFVNLIRELQNVEGDVAKQLSVGCLDQLAAQSHYFGVRDDLINEVDVLSESS